MLSEDVCDMLKGITNGRWMPLVISGALYL